jgi:hypothetical protein
MEEFLGELLKRIRSRIAARGFSVVYDNDLSRIAAPLAKMRQKQIREIEEFAPANGLSVEIRDTGLNATFRMPHRVSDAKQPAAAAWTQGPATAAIANEKPCQVGGAKPASSSVTVARHLFDKRV